MRGGGGWADAGDVVVCTRVSRMQVSVCSRACVWGCCARVWGRRAGDEPPAAPKCILM